LVPPFTGTAAKTTTVPAQTVVDDAVMVTDGVTIGFTVILMVLDTTVLVVAQPAFDVNSHATWSALFNTVELYVLLLVPTFMPFSFHWYAGVAPPFSEVAVNVTPVPAQITVADAAMITEGVTWVVTVIVIALERAVPVVRQDSLEVNSQVTWSPLVRPGVEKALVLLPALLPFTFHWYTGEVPPLVAFAVNTTFVPEQMTFAEALIVTTGVSSEFTVMVTVLEATFATVTQPALEVISQLTWSPLLNMLVV
jgi:hypothetical protein